MTTHDVEARPPVTGRPWLRTAGWLVLLPPLLFLHELLLVFDRFPRANRVWIVVESYFGFWLSDRPTEVRLRAAAALLLFLVAGAVGLLAAFGGIGRIVTLLTAAAQALVCPLGIVWNYQTFGSLPPSAIRKLPVPVPGGRVTCILYLGLAVGAFICALVDRPRARTPAAPPSAPPAPAPPPFAPPPSAAPPFAPPQPVPPPPTPPASGWRQ